MKAAERPCSDCPGMARELSEVALMRGGTVRESGEALCAGCSSRRVLLVRQVDALPPDLALIKAQRLPPAKKTKRKK